MAENYDDIIDEVLAAEVEIKREPKDTVVLNEIVELFIQSTIPDIMEEYEIPRINIIFSDEAIVWFRELLKTPFKKEGYLVSNMTEEDIERLSRENQVHNDCPTVVVKDHIMFFELLTDIMNEQTSLYYDYGRSISARSISLMLLRKLWLRMGPEDFNNVELFLEKQLDFLKSREFDNPWKEFYLCDYKGNKITYEVEMSETWCESTRRMYFRIYDEGKNYHDLPKIYYDICDENGEKVCYISAVQMNRHRNRIKSIERKLYKLSKGISDCNVHPNFLMAMNLFYQFLRAHNITHIKVPVMQILSYRYHELLSQEQRELFENKWNDEKIEYLNSLKDSTLWYNKSEYKRLLRDYELDKLGYDKFVDKEDFISKNKIEGLINLFIHMTYLDDMMVINTDPYINASYLDISISEREFGSRFKK